MSVVVKTRTLIKMEEPCQNLVALRAQTLLAFEVASSQMALTSFEFFLTK